jgi:hypothetical protein
LIEKKEKKKKRKRKGTPSLKEKKDTRGPV